MLPKIGKNDEQARINHHPLHKIETDKKLPPETKTTVDQSGSASRLGDLQMRGRQQRERLERLIPATTAGISTLGAARLLHAASKADKAWTDSYQKGIREFQNVQPDIKARAEQIANSKKIN